MRDLHQLLQRMIWMSFAAPDLHELFGAIPTLAPRQAMFRKVWFRWHNMCLYYTLIPEVVRKSVKLIQNTIGSCVCYSIMCTYIVLNYIVFKVFI